MQVISKTEITNFLNTCTVFYDSEDSYTDIVFLKDDNNVSVAHIDFKEDEDQCDDSIYISDDIERAVLKEQKLKIFEFMESEVKDDRKRKLELIEDISTESRINSNLF